MFTDIYPKEANLFGFLIENLLVCFSNNLIMSFSLYILVVFLCFSFPMVKSVMHRSVITFLWHYLIKNTTKYSKVKVFKSKSQFDK